MEKENKIIRLLILRDGQEGSKTISGFVALRKNDVLEVSNSGGSKSLIKQINEYMNELMKDYPEVLNDVNNKKDANEIIKAFTNKGYLIEAGSKKSVILKLNFNTDKVLKIEYADGHNEIFEKKVVKPLGFENLLPIYNTYLSKLKQQYNLANVENYKTLCDTNLNLKNTASASASEDYDDEYDGVDFGAEFSDDGINNQNTKKIKVSKKLIALVTAGAVLALTGQGFYKLGKRNNTDGVYPTPTPTSTITPISEKPLLTPVAITDEYVQSPTEISLPTVNPYGVYTSIMSQEELALEPQPYPIESYDPIDSPELWSYIYPDHEETINIGDVNYSSINSENLFSVSYENMWDLSNYLFNGEYNENLETTPMRIHFEKIVQGLNEVEKRYIKYFSDLRNEIVYQGFQLNDFDKVMECNRYTIYELLRCVANDNPLRLNVNGREIFVRYSDLGYEAQDTIEKICWGNYLLMGTDTIEFNGEEYNQDRVGLDVLGLTPEASPKF